MKLRIYCVVLLACSCYSESDFQLPVVELSAEFSCFKLTEVLKEEIVLCFFIKSNSSQYESSSHVILRTMNVTAAIKLGDTTITLASNGKTDSIEMVEGYQFYWTKICIFINHKTIIRATVNYNSRQLVKEPSINSGEGIFPLMGINSVQDLELQNEVINDTICYGNIGSQASTFLTGLILESKFEAEEDPKYSVVVENDDKILCLGTFNSSTVYNSFLELALRQNSSSIKQKDICRDTYILEIQNLTGNYHNHYDICKSMNGRLLNKEEHYCYCEEHFNSMHIFSVPYTSCELQLVQGEQLYLQKTSVLPKNLCIHTVWHTTRIVPKNCSTKFDCYACLVSRLQPLRLYGEIDSTERDMILKNASSIVGIHSSLHLDLSKSGIWTLQTSKDRLTAWKLDGKAIPIGKRQWNGEYITNEFLITVCKSTQFPCLDGSCAELASRCNGLMECLDGSDEVNCFLIEKKLGYDPTNIPGTSNISYMMEVQNMKHIEAAKDTITLAIMVSLCWVDPRLIFGNLHETTVFNCSSIWNPKVNLYDKCNFGFPITPTYIQTNCYPDRTDLNTIEYSPDSLSLDKIVDGTDQKLIKTIEVTIEVPCHFRLEKYPYGMPECALCIKPVANNVRMHQMNNTFDITSNLVRTTFGEMSIININDRIIDNNIVLSMKFRLNDSFHLFNTFIPSSMVAILCYATVFFSINDFSNRIAISLTSLLVLVGLFSQINENSVKTSYVKLIDLWYVVLMFYCFLIVVFHSVLEKILTYPIGGDDENKEKVKKKKEKFLIWISRSSRIIFGLFFIGLVTVFTAVSVT